MPGRGLKGVLIGCGAVLVLAAIGVFLVARYASKNQDRWIARSTEIRDAGLALGKSKRESDCVAESLDQYRGDRSIMSAIRVRIWLSGCLESSAVEHDFCTNVPPETEIARSAPAW